MPIQLTNATNNINKYLKCSSTLQLTTSLDQTEGTVMQRCCWLITALYAFLFLGGARTSSSAVVHKIRQISIADSEISALETYKKAIETLSTLPQFRLHAKDLQMLVNQLDTKIKREEKGFLPSIHMTQEQEQQNMTEEGFETLTEDKEKSEISTVYDTLRAYNDVENPPQLGQMPCILLTEHQYSQLVAFPPPSLLFNVI